MCIQDVTHTAGGIFEMVVRTSIIVVCMYLCAGIRGVNQSDGRGPNAARALVTSR